jgi:hypothetical protein
VLLNQRGAEFSFSTPSAPPRPIHSNLSLPTWPDSCCHDFRELAFIERSHLGRNGGIFDMAKTTTYGSSEIIKEPQISHPS